VALTTLFIDPQLGRIGMKEWKLARKKDRKLSPWAKNGDEFNVGRRALEVDADRGS